MEFCFLNKEHICAFINDNNKLLHNFYGEVINVKIQKKDISNKRFNQVFRIKAGREGKFLDKKM
jgi:hypothetical protein